MCACSSLGILRILSYLLGGKLLPFWKWQNTEEICKISHLLLFLSEARDCAHGSVIT